MLPHRKIHDDGGRKKQNRNGIEQQQANFLDAWDALQQRLQQ
jgi:hypothetical protein